MLESRQRWIKLCIQRIQKLDIQYSKSNNLRLSSRDIWTVRGMLILQSGLAYDLLHHRYVRGLDKWLMFISEPKFFVADFVDSNKIVRAEILKQLVYQSFDSTSTRLFKEDVMTLGVTSWGAIAPISDILEEEYTLMKIAQINQWTSFSARLCLRDVDFSTDAFIKYIEDEEYVRQLTYSENDPLVSMMTDVVAEWYSDYKTNWNYCSHGSGACAEVPRGTPSWAKNLLIVYDEKVRYLTLHNPQLAEILPPNNGDWDIRTNVVQAVPKTTTKNRLVSKEPATIMFLQHAIERSLKEYNDGNEELAAHFHSRDQCVNRRQALHGSQDGSYATFDQSDASDMVSVQIVRTITRKCPNLRRDLICTRSSKAILHDGKADYILPISKFAPMGSDTCFETEKIVFGSAIEAAIRLKTGKPSRRDDWSIVGDDLTVKAKYVDIAMKALLSLGFRLNKDKSFYINVDGPYNFRESCGAECLAGIDITPLRISRFFVLFDVDNMTSKLAKRDRPHCVDNLISLANKAWDYGLFGVRYACLQLLELIGIPFQSLEWVPTNSFPNMYDYYILDGERRYDWLSPVPVSRDTLSPVSPLPGIRTFPNHFYGYWNTPRQCLTTVTVESSRLTRIYLARIKKLNIFSIDNKTIEEAMLADWFCQARQRELHYYQKEAIAYSWSEWTPRDSYNEDYLPITIQRNVMVPSLQSRVRPAVLPWVW